MDGKYDVFISYRRDGGLFYAASLHDDLEEAGFRVFWDKKDIPVGAKWKEVITQAIDDCADFVIFLSPGIFDRYSGDQSSDDTPNDPDYVLFEFNQAQQEPDCSIIPCILAGFKGPATAVADKVDGLSKLLGLEALTVEDNYHTFKNDLLPKLQFTANKKLIDDYYRTMIDKDFVNWESEFLIREYSKEGSYEFAEIGGHKVPVIVFAGSKDVHYPFKSMCKREDLKQEGTMDLKPFQDQYPSYKYIVYPNVRHPHLVGYYLEGYNYDSEGNICGIKASTHKYVENIFSSHILDFEMYDVYTKHRTDPSVTLGDFPLRSLIHRGNTIKDVIENGASRASLFSVQMAVISPNSEGIYEMPVIHRSLDVAARPGFWQLPPAGGFELFDLEAAVEDPDERDRIIQKNFDVRMALMREYIEELFDGKDFDEATGNDDWNRIKYDSHFNAVDHYIAEGKAIFEFLGVTTDLISLRPELSFMLIIDDPRFTEEMLTKNKEAAKIERLSLEDVDDLFTHSSKVVLGSLGLFYLLKKNKRYQELEARNKERE